MGAYDTSNELIYNNRIYHVNDVIKLNNGALYYDADGPSHTSTDTSWLYRIDTIYPNKNIQLLIRYVSGSAYEQGNLSGFIKPEQISEGGAQYQSIYSFNANGGSGAPGAGTKTYGKVFVFPATKPTRTGYSFLGWRNDSAGGAKNFQPNEQFWGPDTNVEWKAQWQANTYTVTYNANGGSDAPTAQTKTHGVTLTLSTIKPTRAGYTFKQWNTASNGSGTGIAAGGAYTLENNRTLYAIWTANSYTLTVNPNGGTWNTSTSSQTFTQVMASTKTVSNPSKTGYTFAGWTVSGSGSVSGTAYTQGAGNCTLTAKWNINSYVLTVNPNNGSWNGSTANQNFTQNYNTTKSIANPTRTGYIFKGWSKSGSGSLSGTTYTYGAGAGTLTAQWERIVYTVTFDASANGGIPNSTRFVNHGDKLGTLPVPEKRYYKFVGWFTSVSGGDMVSFEQVITKNVTYYAQYKIDASASLVIGGQKKTVIAYVKKAGAWKKTLAMVKVDEGWKNSIGAL